MKTRRLPRFSLRALFILLAIAGVWLGLVTKQARRQRNAVRAVAETGGSITYAHHRNSATTGNQSPPGPVWLRTLIGDDCFFEVVAVSWAGKRDLQPAELKWLADFPSLDTVNLNFSNVTDEGLAHLANVRRLKNIELEKCAGVTDMGLSHLAKLPHIEHLALMATSCTDEGVCKVVPKLSRLTYLDVAGIPVTNETAMHFCDLPNLTMLHLSRVGHRAAHDLSGAVAAVKARLPNCRINYWGPEEPVEQRAKHK